MRNSETIGRRAALVAVLLASAAASPALAGTNTIDNPGFETGDATGWITTGGYWSSGWPVPESQYQNPRT